MNLREKYRVVKKMAEELNTEPENVPSVIKKMKKEIEDMNRKIK